MAKISKHMFVTYGRLVLVGGVFWLPVIVFMKLAGEIVEKEPLAFDIPMMLAIHSHATRVWDNFFMAITNFGGVEGVVAASILLALYLAAKKNYKGIILLVAGVGGAAAANAILKLLFHRDRPSLWPHMVSEASFSFPSGHAMASASLAAVIVMIFWHTRYRWWIVGLTGLYMVIVGISRIYLGVHYPSDILAGWSAAIAWVVLVAYVMRRYRRAQ